MRAVTHINALDVVNQPIIQKINDILCYERLTGIDATHAANYTIRELQIYFRTELPADFEDRLVQRMALAYACAVRRQRKKYWVNRPPEVFQIFFRRWLAELIFKERRDLFWRLPPGYRYGVPEWAETRSPKPAPVKVLPEPPKVELVEIIHPVRTTVRQSLPFVHGAELLAV